MEAAGLAKSGADSACEVLQTSIGFICTRGDYFCELEDNLRELKNHKRHLQRLVAHIQLRVREDTRPEMRTRFVVECWFSKVEIFETESVLVIAEADEEIGNKCIRFCCPKNCCSCTRVGIRVSTKLENVKELYDEGNGFTDVVERIPNQDNGWVRAVRQSVDSVSGIIATSREHVLGTGRSFVLNWFGYSTGANMSPVVVSN